MREDWYEAFEEAHRMIEAARNVVPACWCESTVKRECWPCQVIDALGGENW